MAGENLRPSGMNSLIIDGVCRGFLFFVLWGDGRVCNVSRKTAGTWSVFSLKDYGLSDCFCLAYKL